MRHTIHLILAATLLLLALGCGGTTDTTPTGDPTPADAGTETPATPDTSKAQDAGSIAKEIAADPDGADGILAAHGTDQARFEELLYEIAADPALTEAYQAARK